MATYEELFGLRNDSDLRNRVVTACIIAAEVIMNELITVDNHDNRLLWAKSVFTNPDSEADRMFMAIISANEASDVSVIKAASDAAIQTNVDDHIDLFADGS